MSEQYGHFKAQSRRFSRSRDNTERPWEAGRSQTRWLLRKRRVRFTTDIIHCDYQVTQHLDWPIDHKWHRNIRCLLKNIQPHSSLKLDFKLYDVIISSVLRCYVVFNFSGPFVGNISQHSNLEIMYSHSNNQCGSATVSHASMHAETGSRSPTKIDSFPTIIVPDQIQASLVGGNSLA